VPDLLFVLVLAASTATPAPLVGVAPALTAAALRDELRAASQRRQDELAAIARQRAELEKLAAEIAAARAVVEAERARAPRDDKAPPSQGRPETPATAGQPASPDALAKTIKGMKVDQAAALVGHLDRGLAVDVLRRMKPADAGAILEKLKGETAADLFAQMAARPSLHGPGAR